MTPRERFFNALTLKEVDRVPASFVTQPVIVDYMKLTGSKWPEAHYDAEMMAELSFASHELGGVESLRAPYILTNEAEAFGCEIKPGNNDTQPSVLAGLSDFDSIEPVGLDVGNIPVVLDTISLLREKAGDELPVICGIVGPFTIAGHMIDVGQMMRKFTKDKETVKRVLDATVEYTIRYAKEAYKRGADIVMIIEPTATGQIVGPIYFEKFALQPIKEVIDALKGYTVLHICGNSTSILNLMEKTGADGLSIDYEVNIAEAKERVKTAAIIGNPDPVNLLLKKMPNEVKAHTSQILEEGVDIISPGCALAPHTPIENVRAVVEEVKGSKT